MAISGSRHAIPAASVASPSATDITKPLPNARSASSSSPAPNLRDDSEAVPIATHMDSAPTNSCSGNATDVAAMPSGPTPQPMKIVSTTL